MLNPRLVRVKNVGKALNLKNWKLTSGGQFQPRLKSHPTGLHNLDWRMANVSLDKSATRGPVGGRIFLEPPCHWTHPDCHVGPQRDRRMLCGRFSFHVGFDSTLYRSPQAR
jgi:hypothetical protein